MASRLQQIKIPTPITPTNAVGGSRLKLLVEKEKSKKVTPEVPVAVKAFPSTLEMLAELQIDPLSLKADPSKAIGTAWETLKTTVSDSAPKIISQFTGKRTVGEQLKGIAAVGHLAFSPITALFEGVNEIPVLGSVTRLIGTAFVAAGEGSSGIAGKIIDELPIRDEASKQEIKEGVQEITALAAQLALGKVTHIAEKRLLPSERQARAFREDLKKENPELERGSERFIPIDFVRTNDINKFIKEHGYEKAKEIVLESLGGERSRLRERFGEKDSQTIVDKATELAERANEEIPLDIKEIPLKTKMGDVAEAAKARGFEVPEFGVEAKEPVQKRKFLDVPREQLPVRPIETGVAEKGVSALEARMKGVASDQNVRMAKSEAEAKGLDVSIYDKISKPEQMKAAAKYVEQTSQREVLKVLAGEKPTPKGLLTNAIMLALEQRSLREKNVELAIKLASLRSTRMGQEISILTEVEGLSPVSGMDIIIRARVDRAKRGLKEGETLGTKKSSLVKEVKTEQTKLRLKISEAEKLLKEITCK